jgi:hypothetical protein
MMSCGGGGFTGYCAFLIHPVLPSRACERILQNRPENENQGIKDEPMVSEKGSTRIPMHYIFYTEEYFHKPSKEGERKSD